MTQKEVLDGFVRHYHLERHPLTMEAMADTLLEQIGADKSPHVQPRIANRL